MGTEDKLRLKRFIHSEFKSIQKQVLDLLETSVSSEYLWNKSRKRILDITNSSLRQIDVEINLNCDIMYNSGVGDLIEIVKSKGVTVVKDNLKED